MRENGTVAFFNQDRFFGFITPETPANAPDLYFHGSQIESGVDPKGLQTGTKVSYVCRRESPSKPLRAHEVRIEA